MKKNNSLKLKDIGIDTNQEHVVFLREKSDICVSEGLRALSRVKLCHGKKQIVATLNVINSDILNIDQMALSKSAMKHLEVQEGDVIRISALNPVLSQSHIKSKVYGHKLSQKQISEIIYDIVQGNLSNIHLSAFICSFASGNADIDEVIGLTKAMIEVGGKIDWGIKERMFDKHCVGGLPGNRTTPIVVSIIAACGLKIPKTSSRAITSPAGTADTMEVITKVNLSPSKIKEIVLKEGGCFVWGGTANLSPADDILIRVERALEIDSSTQMVASVLSKKKAAGATDLVIDIPVGETAKVITKEEALYLKHMFEQVSEAIDINVKVAITDGSQPIGNGIGPALEALDVISVLKNEGDNLLDLKEKSALLAGELLEISGICSSGEGNQKALEVIESGLAYEKFKSICLAQGSYNIPQISAKTLKIKAEKSGVIKSINNKKIARIAKYAGAPEDKSAGVLMNVKLGNKVKENDTLFTIYSDSDGELNYALNFIEEQNDIIIIE